MSVGDDDDDEDLLCVIDSEFKANPLPSFLLTPLELVRGSFCLGAPHSMLTKALCEERGGWRVMLYSAPMYVGHTCYLCV